VEDANPDDEPREEWFFSVLNVFSGLRMMFEENASVSQADTRLFWQRKA
jgi:hypothetical protein